MPVDKDFWDTRYISRVRNRLTRIKSGDPAVLALLAHNADAYDNEDDEHTANDRCDYDEHIRGGILQVGSLVLEHTRVTSYMWSVNMEYSGTSVVDLHCDAKVPFTDARAWKEDGALGCARYASQVTLNVSPQGETSVESLQIWRRQYLSQFERQRLPTTDLHSPVILVAAFDPLSKAHVNTHAKTLNAIEEIIMRV